VDFRPVDALHRQTQQRVVRHKRERGHHAALVLGDKTGRLGQGLERGKPQAARVGGLVAAAAVALRYQLQGFFPFLPFGGDFTSMSRCMPGTGVKFMVVVRWQRARSTRALRWDRGVESRLESAIHCGGGQRRRGPPPGRDEVGRLLLARYATLLPPAVHAAAATSQPGAVGEPSYGGAPEIDGEGGMAGVTAPHRPACLLPGIEPAPGPVQFRPEQP
jgi:hypothetical protein